MQSLRMQSLRQLANNIGSGIKDALVDDGDEEEEEVDGRQLEDPRPLKALPLESRQPAYGQAVATSTTEPRPLPAPSSQGPGAEEALAAFQGAAAVSVDRLVDEAALARRRFSVLMGTPGFKELLEQMGEGSPGSPSRADFDVDSAEPSVPRIAALCAEVLRQVAPRLLAAQPSSDVPRILSEITAKHDTLLDQHEKLQQRHREALRALDQAELKAGQLDAWQSAHQASTSRIEELSALNAELKEQLRELKSSGLDSEERRKLQRQLAQKEAEVQAASAALQQLQEVIEEGDGASARRCAQLERELEQVRAAASSCKEDLEARLRAAMEATATSTAAASSEEVWKQRLAATEKELRETNLAIEQLLEEKGRRMEEREFLVDRRLVTSMLALHLDHLASGQRALAEQVLRQILNVLGGPPEEAVRSRQQVKAAAAAAEARLAEPLGPAFVDFLTREVDPSHHAANDARTAPAEMQDV